MLPEDEQRLYNANKDNPAAETPGGGKSLWQALVRSSGDDPRVAAAKLNQIGIPGIKYLDKGEPAYSVFDPSILHITPEQVKAAAVAAERPVPTEAAPELPFERTVVEEQLNTLRQSLAGSIQVNAEQRGYPDMPIEEAGTIADKMIDATPQEAEKIFRDLQMSPRQVADAPRRLEPPAEPIPTPVEPVADIHAADFQGAVRADLDRELPGIRGREEEVRFPTAIDADGNISYQSIDKALNEVDSYKTAADQIAACASPTPPAEAA